MTTCTTSDVQQSRPRLCVLLTCFNRRANTLACLQALQDNSDLKGVELSAVLVDDGSRDGTATEVRERFSWARVIVNDGPPLFWCRGMHRALAEASKESYDFYLLLNDDTLLATDAIARLLACAQELRLNTGHPLLVVGSTNDAITGVQTYGGQRQVSMTRPTTFKRVPPTDAPQRLDTFNGNVVLLPADVVAKVGNLDSAFEHAMGDIDYGLRARRAGVELWLAPGYHGSCSNNPASGTFNDASQGPRSRWRHMLSRKGLPWRSWLHFTRRHCGLLWPVYFVWPYARTMTSAFLKTLRGKRAPADHA
jgi:GT2 family glycosyltransferase